MDNSKRQDIFISYCWSDGNRYADDLQLSLKDKFEVFRDKTSMNCSDNMNDFMFRIAQCDNVVLVITADYLKSINCMMEMSYLVSQPDWMSKTTILVIDDKIYDMEHQLKLIRYWRDALRSFESLVADSDLKSELVDERIETIKSINNTIENFIIELKNHKNPSQITVVQEIIKRASSIDEKKKGQEAVSDAEQFIKDIIKEHGSASISDIMNNSQYSRAATQRLIQKLVEKGELQQVGAGRGRKIELVDNKD